MSSYDRLQDDRRAAEVVDGKTVGRVLAYTKSKYGTVSMGRRTGDALLYLQKMRQPLPYNMATQHLHHHHRHAGSVQGDKGCGEVERVYSLLLRSTLQGRLYGLFHSMALPRQPRTCLLSGGNVFGGTGMTLLITLILVYGFKLSGWVTVLAIIIWIFHLIYNSDKNGGKK